MAEFNQFNQFGNSQPSRSPDPAHCVQCETMLSDALDRTLSPEDQAVFDLSFPRATLWFRPPTAMEIAATQTGAGFVRAWGGPVQVLFLAALALAARSGKELVALASMFLAGQVASVLAMPHTGWQPAPRFVEAAAALAVAYLAVEILLLPEAGWRWTIAAMLGLFHGLRSRFLHRPEDWYRDAAGLCLRASAIARR